MFDICSIRKKLNWKDNRNADIRSVKRQRLDDTACLAHLTIWDNSIGVEKSAPLRVWTQHCHVTQRGSGDSTNSDNRVNIQLESPFIIPKRDLRVQGKLNGERCLVMAEQYFIEIKILPTRDNLENWPPILLLGKSDADGASASNEKIAECLNGALVARYHSLTPDTQTPLSVFFYFEGKPFRSKYGLEVRARWQSRQDSIHRSSRQIGTEDTTVEDWMMDKNGLLFGMNHDGPENKMATNRADVVSKGKLSGSKQGPTLDSSSSTRFKIEPTMSGVSSRKYREFVLMGLSCLWCDTRYLKTPDLLVHHLQYQHNKYSYSIDARPRSNKGRRTTSNNEVTITVTDAPPKQKRYVQHETQTTAAVLDSDVVAISPLNKIRKQHGGFLPLQHVPAARPEGLSREKHPVVKVSGKGGFMTPAFASRSVRSMAAGDPDEHDRSESEDETDDAWLAGQYLENLDDFAQQQQWTDAKRRLAKKWGYHLIQRECYPHSRYISDALLRFVRIEKQWILRKSDEWKNASDRKDLEAESIDALEDFMHELMTNRVINEEVCSDVLTILKSSVDQLELPAEEQKLMQEETRDLISYKRKGNVREQHLETAIRPPRAESPKDIYLPPPSTTCGICGSDLVEDGEWILRCSSTHCDSPGIYFHAQCGTVNVGDLLLGNDTIADTIAQFHAERSSWLCHDCRSHDL